MFTLELPPGTFCHMQEGAPLEKKIKKRCPWFLISSFPKDMQQVEAYTLVQQLRRGLVFLGQYWTEGSVRLLVYLLHILVLQVFSSNRNFNRTSQVITTVLPLNFVCNLGPYITQSLKQFLPWNRQVVQLGSMINLFHSLYYCWSSYWHIGSLSTFCLFGPFRRIF